jgi:type I restriction enzyme R subunit
MLENARKRIRLLVKLIEKAKKKVVYTDFEDELGIETAVDLPEVANGLDLAKFKDKARQFLKAHESHISLQRLRRSQPLTSSDLQELERMLIEAGGSKKLIGKAAEQSQGLGIFIRSLVSMDKEAAVQAFSQLVSTANATPDQIEFVDLIVKELTHSGVMDAGRLYQTPYIDINPLGPEGVFPTAKVDQLFQVLADIRLSAVA